MSKWQPAFRLVTLILCILILPFADSSSADTPLPAKQKIVAAVPPDFPPTYSRDQKTGEAKGFAIDIMNEVARLAGLQVEYVFGAPWAEIQDMLESGAADVIPNLTIDETRKKLFAFTRPVETLPICYIVRKGQDATGPATGMKVGVIKGSVAANLLTARKDLIVVEDSSLQHLLFNLLAGQIDMILTATPNIMKLAIDAGVDDRIRVLQPPVVEGLRGMALRPSDVQLRQQLDSAIDELAKSPRYQEIYAKWWGKPAPFWTIARLVATSAVLLGFVVVGMGLWKFRATTLLNRELRNASDRAERERMKANAIIEAVNDGICIVDQDMKILFQNARHIAIMGDHRGKLCYRAFHGRESACDDCQVLETFRTGQPCMIEKLVATPAGDRYLEIFASPIRNERNEITSAIEYVHDATERHLAEEQRIKDLVFIETLMKNSPMGIRVFEADSGACVMANQESADIAGGSIEELRVQNFRALDSWQASGLLAVAELVLADGVDRKLNTELQTTFGNKLTVVYFFSRFACNEKIYLLVMGRDITEERRIEDESKRIEQQMLHVQKLESLGVLAGGIAHDFNNILMAIIGNADLALMRINPESPAVDNLRKIEYSVARAADLAKQMLAYSGKGKFVIESIDLNRLVEEMTHMMGVSISKKALLRFNYFRPLPSVDVDATQIRQVIMNLVINASEAIGDQSGIIAITTGCMDCDRTYFKDIWLDKTLEEGLYVFLEVADTGCGMDRETQAKIFDPFFTTKFTGRGLGMAAVLGIVRGHNGAIKVYSEPGRGSTFKMLLPASSRPAELFNVSTQQGGDWRGSGTALLVDDEETVLGIGGEMLRELGFEVITAMDGREGMQRFQEHPEIAIVILDLTMPHLDGEQTFRELRRLRPDVKVIISSGYNELEVTEKFVGKGLAGFIQKPYKLSELREKLREIFKDNDQEPGTPS